MSPDETEQPAIFTANHEDRFSAWPESARHELVEGILSRKNDASLVPWCCGRNADSGADWRNHANALQLSQKSLKGGSPERCCL
jgi:beta-galactosidase/beta-glucuronidase